MLYTEMHENYFQVSPIHSAPESAFLLHNKKQVRFLTATKTVVLNPGCTQPQRGKALFLRVQGTALMTFKNTFN
jgi:hypothetical protein